MSYKNILAIANKFQVKLAEIKYEEALDKTNPGAKNIAQELVEPSRLSPELEEIARKYKEKELAKAKNPVVPNTPSNDYMSVPGAPTPKDSDFAFILGKYLRTIYNSIDNDISDLTQLRYFHGYHRNEMNPNHKWAYSVIVKLMNKVKSLLKEPASTPYETARMFLVYINENTSDILKAAKIIYDFKVIDMGRLPPDGFPAAIEAYKALLNNNDLAYTNPLLRRYLSPADTFNYKYLETKAHLTHKMYYFKLLIS